MGLTVEWAACLALAATLWGIGRLQPSLEARAAFLFWAGQAALCGARVAGSVAASEGNTWGVPLTQWALCMQAWCFFWGAKHWLAAHAPQQQRRWHWITDVINAPWSAWALGWLMALGALAPLLAELALPALSEGLVDGVQQMSALISLGATLGGYAAGCLDLARGCPVKSRVVALAPIALVISQACAAWISMNPAYAAGQGLAFDFLLSASLGLLGLLFARSWTRQQEAENSARSRDFSRASAMAANLHEISPAPLWLWSSDGKVAPNAAARALLPQQAPSPAAALPAALASLGRWGVAGGWGSEGLRAEEWAAAMETALADGRARSAGRWRSAPGAALSERRGVWEIRPIGDFGADRPTEWMIAWEDHEAARQLARSGASSAAKTAALINALPQIAAFGLGGKGEITLWSGRCEELFGQSEATALGSDWSERERLLETPEGPELALGQWAVSEAELPSARQAWALRPGRDPHPVHLTLARLPASRAGETVVWGFALSLEAEDKLEQINLGWATRWDLLEPLTQVGWFILGPNGALEKASPSFLKWFGLTEEEAREGRWADAMENPPKALQAWRLALRSRQHERGRWRVKTPIGWRWIETQVSPANNEKGFWGWMGCVADLGPAETPEPTNPLETVENANDDWLS